MKESNQEYRKDLADKIRGIKEIDKDLASEYLDKAKDKDVYKEAKEESVKERNENINERNLADEEKIKKEKIDSIKKEIEEMQEGTKNPVDAEKNKENQEKKEKSPDFILDDIFSRAKRQSFLREEQKQLDIIQKTLSSTTEALKSSFKNSVKQSGLSLDAFYEKNNFFAKNPTSKENRNLSLNEMSTKFKKVESNKLIERLRKNPEKNNPNIFSVDMSISSSVANHGIEPRFLGLGKKEYAKYDSNLSEQTKIFLFKELGLIEEDYKGELMKHPNFRVSDEDAKKSSYSYGKNIALSKIPGVTARISVFNDGHKKHSRNFETNSSGNRVSLEFGKEFFDKTLEKVSE